MDWTIRRATTDAAPAVREIARESWHAAYDDILGPDTVADVTDDWYAIEELEVSIRKSRETDDEEFLLAVPARADEASDADPDPNPDATASSDAGVSAEIEGFAHAGLHPDDPTAAYLVRLYVRPGTWGEGTGTALLERIEATFEPTCDRLRLTVLADNEIGVSFYESAGFERVQTRQSDLGDGIDECIYEKAL
ncbi:GNAT family N-acetyltransferase [Halopiger xanaduensis]|uniref:GCN5-related N-acetyltransferase n=1 Tax=Halopiger xanaduensis (strain DSM 18323 / JCM 14033 / SH-6) TaxID=797210 RepID=F8D7V4_HALXS|nr:GNAT family N-acetyltransferase [Halopiger xanaduensis]AEH36685.1 GCN5-related N-acetyltransferase [Halopiger xanaduensis SH-6]